MSENNRSVVPEPVAEASGPAGRLTPTRPNSPGKLGAKRAHARPRALGYIRVSTEEQAAEGVSLAAQREKLRQYAELHELELLRVIEDAGVSARNLDRDGLNAALACLKRNEADGLIVLKLDRLSRSVGDWNRLIEEFFSEAAGKQLWSVSESIDTRTAAGRLVLNVLMSVAQWEREIIAERTRESLAYKRTAGKRYGPIPFGFEHDPSTDSLLPNEAEQSAIAQIAEKFHAGASPRQIARELNDLGVKTKTGRGPWSAQAVARIIARSAAK